MTVITSRACGDDDTVGVRSLRELLDRPGVTNLARVYSGKLPSPLFGPRYLQVIIHVHFDVD